MKNINRVCILGDGGWGTTLSILLSKKGIEVSLWGAFPEYIELLKASRENKKFLPSFQIPQQVLITPDLNEAAEGAQAIIFAIPSQFLRGVAKKIHTPAVIEHGAIPISAVKGIEDKTFKRPSEIIEEETGLAGIVVISGPTIAHEVAKGLPASCVAASEYDENAASVQDLLISESFRVYTSSDIVGVELGGALKNIIAIAAGISDGLKLGTNAKSALFTRGLVEMKRLGTALGAKEETFHGLSGMGDLLTTCVSPYSRNRHVGEEIARGKVLGDILKGMEMVAEGIATAKAVYHLSQSMEIDLPITSEVYKVLFEGKDPLSAVSDLMTRSRKSE